nr:DUF3153 domain-containing protein [Antrihabitans sp. YC2-6]
MLLLILPVIAGCQQVRISVAMGVSADDKVSGQIVAATDAQSPEDKGPQLTVPDSLAGKVRVQEYKADNFVGSQAFFSELSFGDLQQLGQMSDQSAGSFQIQLQRSGDLVSLTGKVDLSKAPADGTDVQFKVAFPARVTSTNGVRENDKVVSWKLQPGDITALRAEVRYADPNTRSFAGWAGIVGGVCLGVSAIIGALAYVSRNARPRRPATAPPEKELADA